MMQSKVEILELRKELEKEYEEFIFEFKESTFFHQLGWKNVIQKTYGFKPVYLIAELDGRIVGILPLFLVYNKLISVPFSPYGGVCAVNEDVKIKLISEAIQILKERDLDYLEIREIDTPNYNINNIYNNFIHNYNYVTFIIDLKKDLKELWMLTAKSARRTVKKSMKKGIKCEYSPRYIRQFYEIYLKRCKELGSPQHSYEFFRNIIEEFPGKSNIQVAILDGEVVGCKFLFFFKNKYKRMIISGWAATKSEYRSISPNSILTWELIKFGHENKYTHFDFGRSEKNSGTFRFKKAWAGATVVQLRYAYLLNRSKKIPDLSKRNPKRVIFSKLWQKLPISLTRRLGPSLRKRFP